MAFADVLLVEGGGGAVEGDLDEEDGEADEAVGVGLRDQAAVRDDDGLLAVLLEELEDLEDLGAREGLAAREGDVIEVDLREGAVDEAEELGARQGADRRGILAEVVVAIAALLVAEGRQLDREGVPLGALHRRGYHGTGGALAGDRSAAPHSLR
jgi:hypothetical protein